MRLNTPERLFAVVRRHGDDGSDFIFQQEIDHSAEAARNEAEVNNKKCGPNWRDTWPILRIIPVDVTITPV